MIDTTIYIILENHTYQNKEEAIKQIQECYSNLLGVIPYQDGDKWIVVRDKRKL